MKRFMLPAILVGALLVLVLAVPAAAKSGKDYVGRWVATDVDDSNLELWITRSGWSGGRVLNLRARDDRTGGWCGGHARMQGIGVLLEDNTLETSAAWWCLDPVENIIFPVGGSLTYDPSTDTLVEGDVTWHRAP